MEVTIVGNMCTWTKKLSSSYIINDDLMIDAPLGSFKTLYCDYDLSKIKYILITHFHSDHFLDLQTVLDFLSKYTDKHLKILAPKGCRERLIALIKIIEQGHLELFINNNVEFIDCENGKTIKLGNYKIKSYRMTHGDLDAYGFTIEDANKTKIGFTGDTCMCNSLHKLIKHSQAVFIDVSATYVNKNHICADEYFALQKEYENVELIPTHMSVHSIKLLDGKVKLYNQGDKITF